MWLRYDDACGGLGSLDRLTLEDDDHETLQLEDGMVKIQVCSQKHCCKERTEAEDLEGKEKDLAEKTRGKQE